MIPIRCSEDVAFVANPIIRAGLQKEFKRLPDDYEYPTFGYFIVIESLDELLQTIPLEYSSLFYTPEPLSDYVEMIEEFDGYCQVVCILYADFGVSLFVSEEIATHSQLETLFEI